MNANIADLLKKISTYIDLSHRKPLPEIEHDILLRTIQELYESVKYGKTEVSIGTGSTIYTAPAIPPAVATIAPPAEEAQLPTAEPVSYNEPEIETEVESEDDTHISIQQLVRESLKQKEEEVLAAPLANIPPVAEVKTEEPIAKEEPEIVVSQSVTEEPYTNETEEEEETIAEQAEEDDLIEEDEDITEDSEEDESLDTDSGKPRSINEVYKANSGSLYEKAQTTSASKNLHSSVQHQSVKSQIDLNRRILFTRDLFNSDGIAYNNFIESLDFCNTFEEARDKVNTKAKELKWKGDSQTVRLLVKLVKTRFGM